MLCVVGVGAEEGQGIFFCPAVISKLSQTGVGMPGSVRIPMISRVV